MDVEVANIAEFRQNASRVFERLAQSGEIVVLRNGRPVGLLVGADAFTLDVIRVAMQRARSQIAVERIRAASVNRGLDRLSMPDADRLVRGMRRKRSQGKKR